MRTDIPADLLAHLRLDQSSTAILWTVEKTNGAFIRGTDHDRDIEILTGDAAGVYQAGSNITGSKIRRTGDSAVDNMDIDGAIPATGSATIDVSVQDIEAGLLRRAEVRVYLCNWQKPTDGVYLVQRGNLGDITRDSDFKYSTEIRGLKQSLAQVFVRTYSERCQVRDFGDDECGVDVTALQKTGTVTAVTSRRRFDATLTGGQPAGYYSLGQITFTSGANSGYTREIRRDDEGSAAGHISIWDQLPAAVQVGDTFTIRPGCDRRFSTCRDKYANQLNFRGYGIFIEGLDALMRGPN